MTKLKGLRFQSFEPENQGPGRSHTQWIAHTGKKARLRYLRNICKPTLTSTDPEVIAILEIVGKLVDNSEFALLQVLAPAKQVADANGTSIVEVLKYEIEKAIKNAQEQEERRELSDEATNPQVGDAAIPTEHEVSDIPKVVQE